MKEGKTGRDGMGRKEEQGWERAVLATHVPAGAGAEAPIRASLGAGVLLGALVSVVASAGWGTLPFPRVLSGGEQTHRKLLTLRKCIPGSSTSSRAQGRAGALTFVRHRRSPGHWAALRGALARLLAP